MGNKMESIVAKFGGSSLADAGQIRKVIKIIEADDARRLIVPSAPGKRYPEDTKVTDMLYAAYEAANTGGDLDGIMNKISARFAEIRDGLKISFNIEKHIYRIKEDLKNGASEEYAASRGEFLNGMLLASKLGCKFIDAADVIHFDRRGRYVEAETKNDIRQWMSGAKRAVLPVFYGSMPDGEIKTFSRGGSDVTGAIAASAINAKIYENWTDVDGIRMTDPRIVADAEKIDVITYKELRELSYMGASVLHEDAIFPVYQAAIPINVRNTNNPGEMGTMIVPETDVREGDSHVTGIAGKKGFTVLSIEKNGMNAELGFGRKVLACVEKYGLPFEHMPSSIDSLCVVLEDARAGENIGNIVDDIHRSCEPDSVEVIGHMALIATVGRGMISNVGTAAKIFVALAEEKINIRMIDQGSSEMNIIVGVETADFERAIRAIYHAFRK